jgi:lipopolysaccharide export system protein LptC
VSVTVDIDTGAARARMARSAEAFLAAQRHSRVVRRLRWMLPVGVVVIAVVFALLSLIATLASRISIGSISLQGNQLVMERPRLTGFDSQRRPYEVMAEMARQDIGSPKRFELRRIDASMSFGANGRARVTANEGTFDGDAETFHVRGDIEVTTNIGYTARMEEALVDLKRAGMVTERPVEARNGQDMIRADRLEVSESGAVMVFEGNVRLTITGAEIAP